MQSAYADLEAAKNFYYTRKREIEETIGLLQERVEAEKAYALRLFKIGGGRNAATKGISLGRLGEEVSAFVMDCQAKARQAEELAANV